MSRAGRVVPVYDANEAEYDEYEGGEEGGYYGAHGDSQPGTQVNEDGEYEDGEEGVTRKGESHPAAVPRRRALTESEEDDRLAEEEEDDGSEEVGVSYEEYLKQKKAGTQIGPSLPPLRQANEGRQLNMFKKQEVNLEEEELMMRQEVSYEPAVSAPSMRWVEVEVDPEEWPSPRAFHAACAVHLPGRPPFIAVSGGADLGISPELWFFYPGTNAWKRKLFQGQQPPPRQSHAMAFLPAPHNHSIAGRLYLISGVTSVGKESMVYVLTFAGKEDDGVWGYHHSKCSDLSEKLSKNAADKSAINMPGWCEPEWCGCEDYIRQPNPKLFTPHQRPFFCRFSEEWQPVAFHSAVTAPASIWVYGGKTLRAVSPHMFSMIHPVQASLTAFQRPFVVHHQNITWPKITTETAQLIRVGTHKTTLGPGPRFGHVAAYLQSKGMYLIGGNDGKRDCNDVWLLPYGSTDWQKESYTGIMPRLSGAASAVVDTYIFIYGGRSGEHVLGNLFVYNTKDSSVRQVEVPGATPSPRVGHIMVRVENNMYIYGGKDSKGQTLADLIILENVTDFTTRATRLGSDLLKELKDAKFSDFTIVTSDKQRIRTHRTFLAARTAWFRNKLLSNPGMSEVVGTEPYENEDTWKRLLEFLYSDNVTLSAAQAPLIKALAKSLQLNQLVAICDNIVAPSGLKVPIAPSAMQSDMQTLLDSGLFSDVRLVAQHKDIRAHKAVLAARCPFFRAMFTSKFKEGTGDYVELPDMEPIMLEAVVNFIYTEALDHKDFQLAFELLAQSDLLELPDLKDRCATVLLGALSTENAALLHEAADLYNAPVLTNTAFRFLYDAVIQTAGMDDDLILSLSTPLFVAINVEREKHGLPTVVQRVRRELFSWNDTCKTCSNPYSWSGANATAWKGVPKDRLVEACGGAANVKYEPVLSLRNQVGHKSVVTLPNGKKVSFPLPRNTRRDAEQATAAAAYHVMKCGFVCP